jgi:hypothetical protein
MPENNKELLIRVRADLQQALKQLHQLESGIEGVATTAKKPINDPTKDLERGLIKTRARAVDLRRELTGLFSLAALYRGVKAVIDETRKMQSALLGLRAVSEHAGVGIQQAWAAVTELTKDGLISVSDAAKSLQNLLARGYNLDQSISTIQRLKDAAAFNRVAHLSMSEAVLTATEGLKNENSILVDNAGVTKNVSVMWKEYAKQIGKTVDQLSLQEKVQAEVNGILRETTAQAGNAAQAAEGVEGKIANFNKALIDLKNVAGDSLLPALTQLAGWGSSFIKEVVQPLVGYLKAYAVWVGFLVKSAGDISSGDFSQIKNNFKVAEEMMREHIENAKKGSTDLTNEIGKMGKAATDSSNLSAQALDNQTNSAADYKKQLAGINDQLRTAIDLQKQQSKAVQESRKATKDLATSFSEARAGLGNKGGTPDIVGISNQTRQSEQLFDKGDYDGAVKAAEKARDMIVELGEAGGESELVLRGLLTRAEQAGTKAAKGIETNNENALQQTNQVITNLLAEAEKLKALKVGLDSAAAQAQASSLLTALQAQFAANPLVIPVVMSQSGDLKVPQEQAIQQVVTPLPIKRASGGPISGPGTGRSDSILMWGSNGEFMQPADSVSYYGHGFMEMIRRRQLPRYADGGLIGAPPLPSLNLQALAMGGGGTPINLYLDGQKFPVTAQQDIAKEIERVFHRSAMQRGRP